jgi:hypothetical protein
MRLLSQEVLDELTKSGVHVSGVTPLDPTLEKAGDEMEKVVKEAEEQDSGGQVLPFKKAS